MITLNGLSLPAPTALSVKAVPQAGTSQYNSLGRLVQDGMKEKRTVQITWARMAGDVLAQLAALLNAGGFLHLIYPDPLSGRREMDCRVTEQSAGVWRYRDGAPLWANVQLILEEQ